MDATSMTFEDDRFDLAVDKGTLDAMMSAGDQEHTLAGAARCKKRKKRGFVLVGCK